MRPRKELFQIGGFYHIYNRGVDKSDIFRNDNDRIRFLKRLGELKKEDVSIIAYCLMNNHYHILLRQDKDNGISKVMQKLSTAYTLYFNRKYQRTDSLFGSRYQVVPVKNDRQLMHITRYIHLNPLDMVESAFRSAGIFNKHHVARFLCEYKWSSFHYYLSGIEDAKHGHQLDIEPIYSYFSDPTEYQNFVLDWAFQSQTSESDSEV